jgi:hypothetical protein
MEEDYLMIPQPDVSLIHRARNRLMYDELRYDLCCIGWWVLLAASVCSYRVCCGHPRSVFVQPADVGGVGDVHGRVLLVFVQPAAVGGVLLLMESICHQLYNVDSICTCKILIKFK